MKWKVTIIGHNDDILHEEVVDDLDLIYTLIYKAGLTLDQIKEIKQVPVTNGQFPQS